MGAESSTEHREFLSVEGAKAALARLPALKTSLEEFEPWDNIPWAAQAEQLLRCRIGDGFIGLRPPARVDREVEALIERFGLPTGARLLDLGCGPGMYGNRLGARGFHVVGIDIAGPVVAHAQAHADTASLPCRYHEMSFLEMGFDTTFHGAFLANSIFNQLSESELAELLARVRRALVPTGRFVCEVSMAPGGRGSEASRTTRRLSSLPYSPWSPEPHHWLERTSTFPAERQTVTHHVIIGVDGSLREYWSRSHLYTFDEMTARLRNAGFEVLGWYDRDLRSPVGPDAECVWVVAGVAGGSDR